MLLGKPVVLAGVIVASFSPSSFSVFFTAIIDGTGCFGAITLVFVIGVGPIRISRLTTLFWILEKLGASWLAASSALSIVILGWVRQRLGNRSYGVFSECRFGLFNHLLRRMVNIIVVVVAAKLVVAPLIKLIAIRIQEATVWVDKKALRLVSTFCLFRLLLINFLGTLCLFSVVLFYRMPLLLACCICVCHSRLSVWVSVCRPFCWIINSTNLFLLMPSILLNVALISYKFWIALFYLVAWGRIMICKDRPRSGLRLVVATIVAIFIGLAARCLVLSLSTAWILRSCLGFVGWHLF